MNRVSSEKPNSRKRAMVAMEGTRAFVQKGKVTALENRALVSASPKDYGRKVATKRSSTNNARRRMAAIEPSHDVKLNSKTHERRLAGLEAPTVSMNTQRPEGNKRSMVDTGLVNKVKKEMGQRRLATARPEVTSSKTTGALKRRMEAAMKSSGGEIARGRALESRSGGIGQNLDWVGETEPFMDRNLVQVPAAYGGASVRIEKQE